MAAKGGDKMDFQYLFTSFEGRINRAKCWVGTVILALVSIVLDFIIGAIFGSSIFGAILVTLVTLGLLLFFDRDWWLRVALDQVFTKIGLGSL